MCLARFSAALTFVPLQPLQATAMGWDCARCTYSNTQAREQCECKQRTAGEGREQEQEATTADRRLTIHRSSLARLRLLLALGCAVCDFDRFIAVQASTSPLACASPALKRARSEGEEEKEGEDSDDDSDGELELNRTGWTGSSACAATKAPPSIPSVTSPSKKSKREQTQALTTAAPAPLARTSSAPTPKPLPSSAGAAAALPLIRLSATERAAAQSAVALQKRQLAAQKQEKKAQVKMTALTKKLDKFVAKAERGDFALQEIRVGLHADFKQEQVRRNNRRRAKRAEEGMVQQRWRTDATACLYVSFRPVCALARRLDERQTELLFSNTPSQRLFRCRLIRCLRFRCCWRRRCLVLDCSSRFFFSALQPILSHSAE